MVSSDKTAQKCSEGNIKTSEPDTSDIYDDGSEVENKSKKFRGWVATSFNKEPIPFDNKLFKYLAYGKETCPTTGREHWQTFFYCFNQITFSALRKKLKKLHSEVEDYKNIYIRAMRGSFEDNEDYCSKEGHFIEHGVAPKQGRRCDLEAVADDIKQGKVRSEELLEENPMLYHQYGRTLTELQTRVDNKRTRTEQTKGYWIWGGTNTGKSHRCFTGFAEVPPYHPDTHYLWTDDNGWWDEYTGQPYVIMNDFRGELPFNQLLQLLDKWPARVKRRNRAARQFVSKVIIISCSMSPKKCYRYLPKEDKIEQLLRRVEVIYTGENRTEDDP